MIWTKKRRLAKRRRELKRLEKYHQTLEWQLVEVLMAHAGERGHDEGAVELVCRIIRERDQALTILALDRLRNFREGRL